MGGNSRQVCKLSQATERDVVPAIDRSSYAQEHLHLIVIQGVGIDFVRVGLISGVYEYQQWYQQQARNQKQ